MKRNNESSSNESSSNESSNNESSNNESLENFRNFLREFGNAKFQRVLDYLFNEVDNHTLQKAQKTFSPLFSFSLSFNPNSGGITRMREYEKSEALSKELFCELSNVTNEKYVNNFLVKLSCKGSMSIFEGLDEEIKQKILDKCDFISICKAKMFSSSKYFEVVKLLSNRQYNDGRKNPINAEHDSLESYMEFIHHFNKGNILYPGPEFEELAVKISGSAFRLAEDPNSVNLYFLFRLVSGKNDMVLLEKLLSYFNTRVQKDSNDIRKAIMETYNPDAYDLCKQAGVEFTDEDNALMQKIIAGNSVFRSQEKNQGWANIYNNGITQDEYSKQFNKIVTVVSEKLEQRKFKFSSDETDTFSLKQLGELRQWIAYQSSTDEPYLYGQVRINTESYGNFTCMWSENKFIPFFKELQTRILSLDESEKANFPIQLSQPEKGGDRVKFGYNVSGQIRANIGTETIDLTTYRSDLKFNGNEVGPCWQHAKLDPEKHKKIAEHLDRLLDIVVNLKVNPEDKQSVSVLSQKVGEIHWWLAHTMFFTRGSASISEMISTALFKYHGVIIGKFERMPDCVALIEPDIKIFSEGKFHKLFDYTPEPKRDAKCIQSDLWANPVDMFENSNVHSNSNV